MEVLRSMFGGHAVQFKEGANLCSSSRTSSRSTQPREEEPTFRSDPGMIWWAAEVEEERTCERIERQERRDNMAMVRVMADEERARRVREVLLQRALESVEREQERDVVKGMEEAERVRRLDEARMAQLESSEEQARSRRDAEDGVEAERNRQVAVYQMTQADIRGAKERLYRRQVAGAALHGEIDDITTVESISSSHALLEALSGTGNLVPDGRRGFVIRDAPGSTKQQHLKDAPMDCSHFDVSTDAGGSAGDAREEAPNPRSAGLSVQVDMTSPPNEPGAQAHLSAWSGSPTPYSVVESSVSWGEDVKEPTTSFSHRYRSRLPPTEASPSQDFNTPMSEFSEADSMGQSARTPLHGQVFSVRGTLISDNSTPASVAQAGRGRAPTQQALFMSPGISASRDLLASADEVTRQILTKALQSKGVDVAKESVGRILGQDRLEMHGGEMTAEEGVRPQAAASQPVHIPRSNEIVELDARVEEAAVEEVTESEAAREVNEILRKLNEPLQLGTSESLAYRHKSLPTLANRGKETATDYRPVSVPAHDGGKSLTSYEIFERTFGPLKASLPHVGTSFESMPEVQARIQSKPAPRVGRVVFWGGGVEEEVEHILRRARE